MHEAMLHKEEIFTRLLRVMARLETNQVEYGAEVLQSGFSEPQ
jgi:hypothetical protein